MDIVTRFIRAYEHLMSLGLVHKRKDLALQMGISESNISRIFNGNLKYLTPSFLERFNNHYEGIFNLEWLLAGEGEMLASSELTKKSEGIMQTEEYILLQQKFNALLQDYKELKNQAEPLNPGAVIHVPLVNQYAHAGYLNGYQDDTYMNTLPTIPFLADHEAKGNYIAFEVKGDSMDDGSGNGYVEGEILMCREIPQYLWAESKLHIRKWDFVIVHEEGIIVKRIIDHDVENHTITVHSLNDMYPDRVINLAEVKQIFNVIHSQRNRRR